MFWMRRNLNYTINWLGSAKIYISILFAFVLGYTALIFLNLQGWAAIFICSPIFIVAYMLMLPILKIITKGDIAMLKDVTHSLGPFTRVIKIVLEMLERLIK
jgi:hypothetical protein